MRAVIIGAGLGGLCAAIKLRAAGVDDLVILEKNPGVGGTWWENTYPGCACDVPVALYSFSFAQRAEWSRVYAQQPEILAYAQTLVEDFALAPHLRFGVTVTAAAWDEAARTWTVETAAGEAFTADIVVGALGQLNRPLYPDIDGRDSFRGTAMHSARWDTAFDPSGKRVAVIGSAASAAQLVPELAKTAQRLLVFQRTPNWLLPRNDRAITETEKDFLRHAPALRTLRRQQVYWAADTVFWRLFKSSPWARDFYAKAALKHLEAQVADPALRAALTPDYPIGCKRVIFSDDYYPALQRPNARLVTDRIRRIVHDGVVTGDGALHEVDAIVHATGFDATHFADAVAVTGVRGQTLKDAWAQGPEAYLGLLVAGFPNFFLVYGPNTNLGHNSILFMIERQAEYIAACVGAMRKGNARRIDVRPEAQTRFNRELQTRLRTTAWAAGCTSWYKTEGGKITNNWMGSTREYAQRTKKPDMGDLALAG
ncbi:MAG: NAD(P)/FAD-dependent oxidoreductase [Hyphomonadaceae bacterium]|nr:NAD(P)/FAD-dependent oxidoreductase [Hyphomonadaceae bacterium]